MKLSLLDELEFETDESFKDKTDAEIQAIASKNTEIVLQVVGMMGGQTVLDIFASAMLLVAQRPDKLAELRIIARDMVVEAGLNKAENLRGVIARDVIGGGIESLDERRAKHDRWEDDVING